MTIRPVPGGQRVRLLAGRLAAGWPAALARMSTTRTSQRALWAEREPTRQ